MAFERAPEKRNRVIAVRLTDAEIELVESYGLQLAKEQGLESLSASDIIREALRRLGEDLQKPRPRANVVRSKRGK